MPSTTVKGHTLDGRPVEVSIEQGRITCVAPTDHAPGLPLLAPPLVDLQHNGAMGHAYSRLCEGDEGALEAIAAHVRRHAVGRVQATFITRPFEESLRALRAFDRMLASSRELEKLFDGIFYEGNYMSAREGWRGIHPAAHMLEPRWEDWARLQDAAGGRIRVFNIDPERPGALAVIREAVRHGLRVSLGHCGPSPANIRAAADAGADLVTHFGNGAPPLIHRHRNPLWTWLADDRFKLGLIADGHHLPDDLITTAMKAKGRDKVFLVSDASASAGLPPGAYGDLIIEKNGYCHLRDQEILAGAWHQLDRGVNKLLESGWTLADAWSQASIIPARIMGLQLPELASGRAAGDFFRVTANRDGGFSFAPLA